MANNKQTLINTATNSIDKKFILGRSASTKSFSLLASLHFAEKHLQKVYDLFGKKEDEDKLKNIQLKINSLKGTCGDICSLDRPYISDSEIILNLDQLNYPGTILDYNSIIKNYVPNCDGKAELVIKSIEGVTPLFINNREIKAPCLFNSQGDFSLNKNKKFKYFTKNISTYACEGKIFSVIEEDIQNKEDYNIFELQDANNKLVLQKHIVTKEGIQLPSFIYLSTYDVDTDIYYQIREGCCGCTVMSNIAKASLVPSKSCISEPIGGTNKTVYLNGPCNFNKELFNLLPDNPDIQFIKINSIVVGNVSPGVTPPVVYISGGEVVPGSLPIVVSRQQVEDGKVTIDIKGNTDITFYYDSAYLNNNFTSNTSYTKVILTCN